MHARTRTYTRFRAHASIHVRARMPLNINSLMHIMFWTRLVVSLSLSFYRASGRLSVARVYLSIRKLHIWKGCASNILNHSGPQYNKCADLSVDHWYLSLSLGLSWPASRAAIRNESASVNVHCWVPPGASMNDLKRWTSKFRTVTGDCEDKITTRCYQKCKCKSHCALPGAALPHPCTIWRRWVSNSALFQSKFDKSATLNTTQNAQTGSVRASSKWPRNGCPGKRM